MRRRPRLDKVLHRVLIEHVDEGVECGIEDAIDRRRRLDQARLGKLPVAIGLDVGLLRQAHDIADANF